MAYSFARFNTGGALLRLGVLASQMLPPIILVLPLFGVFLLVGLTQSRVGARHRASDHHRCRSSPGCWSPSSRATWRGSKRRRGSMAPPAGRPSSTIAVPVAAPGILAAGLLGFILSWNEFLFALVLSGPDTQTLPVGLASLETHAGVEIAPLAAATVVSLLPVFALLPFLRKHLIKGLSLGALK